MHPNEKALRDVDDAVARGDMDSFWGAHTDNLVTHFAGTSSVAGTYRGRDGFGALVGKFTNVAGEFNREYHEYLATDSHGVVLMKSRYAKAGKTLESDEIYVCHFRDGKISKIWVSAQDQAGLDAFLG